MSQWPDRPSGKIVRAAQAQAWIDGFAFRDAARQQRDESATQAQREREHAKQQGYEQGLAEGRREAARLADSATAQIQSYFNSLSDPIASLSLDIVRRILGTFDNHALITRMVEQALIELRSEHRVVIRVAADNVSALDDLIARLDGPIVDRVSHVEPDHALTSTQCLLISPVAVIDVGLDAQLEALRQALVSGEDSEGGR